MSIGTRTRAHPGLVRLAPAAIVGVLVLTLASGALANPAVDEYKARFPNAKGKHQDSGDVVEPAPIVTELPPPVTKKLKHDRKNGKALAAVATAPDLGAPQPVTQQTDGDESLLGALGRSLLDPLALLLLLALAAIPFGAYRARKLSQAPSRAARSGRLRARAPGGRS